MSIRIGMRLRVSLCTLFVKGRGMVGGERVLVTDPKYTGAVTGIVAAAYLRANVTTDWDKATGEFVYIFGIWKGWLREYRLISN